MRVPKSIAATKEKPIRQAVEHRSRDENELVRPYSPGQKRILHLQQLIGNQGVQRLLTGERLAHTRSHHRSERTSGLVVVRRSIQSEAQPNIQRWWDDEEANSQDSGGSWLDSAVDTVTEAGSSAYNAVSDTASAAYDTASETAGEAYDWASETASGAYDTVSEGASDAYDWASDTAGEAWDTVTDAAGEAADWAGEKASDLGDWASETWDTVSEGVRDAGDWASEKAEEAWDTAKDAGSELMPDMGISREQLETMVRQEIVTQVNAHITATENKFTVKDLDTYQEHDEPLPPIPSFGDFSDRCCKESELDNLISKMQEQQVAISFAESARQVIVDKAKVEIDQLVKNYKADLISSLLSYAVVGAIIGAIVGAFFGAAPGAIIGAIVIAAVLSMVGMYVASAKMDAALTALLQKAKVDLRAANTKVEVEKRKYEAMGKSAASCSNNPCD